MHDVNAPPALAEDYYRLLDAPDMGLVWFDHSGHNPWVSEAHVFGEVVADRFLNGRERPAGAAQAGQPR